MTFLDESTGSTLAVVPLSAGTASWTGSGLSANAHDIAAVYSGDGNYISGAATINLTINPVTPTVSVSDVGGHGTKSFAATAAVTGLNGIAGASLEGVSPILTYYNASGTQLGSSDGAGTYTVVASFPGIADYNPASAQATFTITPATLTVTANNATMVYGSALPTFSDTITGFVNGDTASVVSGSASFSTTATSKSSVGSYSITAAGGTLSAANYTFAFVSGTLTITAARRPRLRKLLRPRPDGRRGSLPLGKRGIKLTGGASSIPARRPPFRPAATPRSRPPESGRGQRPEERQRELQCRRPSRAQSLPIRWPDPAGPTGLTNFGSEVGQRQLLRDDQAGHLQPDQRLGQRQLTLNRGIYIIEGGGFSVSGNASVTGTGVMIFNAGSNVPAATGGTYGASRSAATARST